MEQPACTSPSLLSRRTFDEYSCVVRPALLAEARPYAGQNAEDAVQDALAVAWSRIDTFREATGQAGFARWTRTILRQVLMAHGGAVRRERGRCTLVPIDVDELDDARWSALARGAADADMRSEAMIRLRLANLTERERTVAVALFCVAPVPAADDGEASGRRRANEANRARIKATAKLLHITERSAERARNRAVVRMRRVPDQLVAEEDGDWELFIVCSQVSQYHAPPNRGAALDRERLADMERTDRARYAAALRQSRTS